MPERSIEEPKPSAEAAIESAIGVVAGAQMRGDDEAVAVAARHASEHDRDATFPREAIEALRGAGLLAAYVPREFGGGGRSLAEIAQLCARLGQACGSTGLIYAMHQIQVACLVRHLEGGQRARWLNEIAAAQPLIASSTTEGNAGGDMARSTCAVEAEGDRFRLAKAASVMSYGAEADIILATARRHAEAPPTDQVLAILPKAHVRLEQRGQWLSLGMRGTCSASFDLAATAPIAGVVGTPYREIHAATMEPVAHILWGAVWCGIAAAALETARRYLRCRTARPGPPPGADLFAAALSDHLALRSLVAAAAAAFDANRSEQGGGLTGAGAAQSALKLQTSQLATGIVFRALEVCGLAGYRLDGEHSVERQLRDICSAPIMINNLRLLDTVGKIGLLEEVRPWTR